MTVLTGAELVEEMLRLSGELDVAHKYLADAVSRYAHAEDAYRLAKAAAYLASSGTVPERQAYADQATSVARREAHESEGLKVAALERVRSLRAQLSALQTIAGAVKVEAELAGRYATAG